MLGKARAVLAVVAVAGALAGCGGEDEPSAGSGAKRVTVDVGLIPVADVAPVFVGIRQGFFAKQGLDVRTHFAEGGAAIVPGVLSGNFDIGYSNLVSLLVAHSKRLPIQIVAPGIQVLGTEDSDPCRVSVRGHSGIREPADLEGRSIAVNTLTNIGELTIKAALAKRGVDVSKLKFVEIPFPEMNAALDAKRVDAIWSCQPFLAQGEAAGHRFVLANHVGTQANLAISSYFAQRSFADRSAGVVDRFARGLAQATEYARAHPDAVRAEISRYAKVPPATARKMTLPIWSERVRDDSLKLLGDLSVEYGLVKEPGDLDDLIQG